MERIVGTCCIEPSGYYSTDSNEWLSSSGEWVVGRAKKQEAHLMDIGSGEYAKALKELESPPPWTHLSQEMLEQAKMNAIQAMALPKEFAPQLEGNIFIGESSLGETTTGCGMYDPYEGGEDTG